MSLTQNLGSLAAAGAMALLGVSNAAAATTVVVTPTNRRGGARRTRAPVGR